MGVQRSQKRCRPRSRSAKAKARLSELVAKVQAGEDVIVARGHEPVARLAPLDVERRAPLRNAIEAIEALRARAEPVTVEEVLASQAGRSPGVRREPQPAPW